MKNRQYLIAIGCLLLAAGLTACGEKEPQNPYGSVVADLGDEDAYAFLAMDYPRYVMVSSDMIYDEGTESQAAISCNVYYYSSGKTEHIGSLTGGGTAYPLSFSDTSLFAASGHSVEKYVISDDMLYLEKGIYENFDSSGNASYTCIEGVLETAATEEEYLALLDEYAESQIIHFSYGADGCVNEPRKF